MASVNFAKTTKMKIVIIDNYDSFTYNLVHLLEAHGSEVDVVRSDAVELEKLAEYDKLMLSPGPGLPGDAGSMMAVLAAYAGKMPILGVCLGMQAIVEHFGGTIYNLQEVKHGVSVQMKVVEREDLLFQELPEMLEVGLYHSWAVSHDLPDCLQLTALSEHETVMALRHKELDIHGVQFHPESIMTGQGKKMLQNWVGLW